MKEIDFVPFAKAEPVVWNALVRKGWNSVAALQSPFISGHGLRADLEGWDVFWELPNVGPRRILALVNFLRDNGVELPWMGRWDEQSANWTALEGQRRARHP